MLMIQSFKVHPVVGEGWRWRWFPLARGRQHRDEEEATRSALEIEGEAQREGQVGQVQRRMDRDASQMLHMEIRKEKRSSATKHRRYHAEYEVEGGCRPPPAQHAEEKVKDPNDKGTNGDIKDGEDPIPTLGRLRRIARRGTLRIPQGVPLARLQLVHIRRLRLHTNAAHRKDSK